MQNFDGHNAIINTLAVNEDNVMVSGGDNGSMAFWDNYQTWHNAVNDYHGERRVMHRVTVEMEKFS